MHSRHLDLEQTYLHWGNSRNIYSTIGNNCFLYLEEICGSSQILHQYLMQLCMVCSSLFALKESQLNIK
jgi:hypothetical protein